MIDELEDYDDSCQFIHVRDYELTGLDGYCNNIYAKSKLVMITMNCIIHLNDFKKTCPKSFRIINKKPVDYIRLLSRLLAEILLTISPEDKESIEKLIKLFNQDINM